MQAILVLFSLAALVNAVPSPVEVDVYKNTLTPLSRIIGGQNAERHQFPYQVSILSGNSHSCGGILISETRVLTAAHCKSKGNKQTVILGLLKRNENHEDVQAIKVADFIVHPGYPGKVGANDIAIILLAQPANLTSAVQTAALAAEEECDLIEDAILSGWGLLDSWDPFLPTHLQWAILPRITNEQCARDLKSLLGHSDPLDDSMICTSANPGLSQSACNGDSGGPLVLASSRKLIGVVSWGISPCGFDGAPSVFTRVCAHSEFIQKYL